jgi:hypothetical protein
MSHVRGNGGCSVVDAFIDRCSEREFGERESRGQGASSFSGEALLGVFSPAYDSGKKIEEG